MGRGGNKDNLARLAALSTGGALGRLIRAVETFGFHFAISDVHRSQFCSGSGPSGNDRGQRADPSSSTWLRQQPAAPSLRVRTV